MEIAHRETGTTYLVDSLDNFSKMAEKRVDQVLATHVSADAPPR